MQVCESALFEIYPTLDPSLIRDVVQQCSNCSQQELLDVLTTLAVEEDPPQECQSSEEVEGAWTSVQSQQSQRPAARLTAHEDFPFRVQQAAPSDSGAGAQAGFREHTLDFLLSSFAGDLEASLVRQVYENVGFDAQAAIDRLTDILGADQDQQIQRELTDTLTGEQKLELLAANFPTVPEGTLIAALVQHEARLDAATAQIVEWQERGEVVEASDWRRQQQAGLQNLSESMRRRVEFVLGLFEDPPPDVQLVASTLVACGGNIEESKKILAAANPQEHRLKGRAGIEQQNALRNESSALSQLRMRLLGINPAALDPPAPAVPNTTTTLASATPVGTRPQPPALAQPAASTSTSSCASAPRPDFRHVRGEDLAQQTQQLYEELHESSQHAHLLYKEHLQKAFVCKSKKDFVGYERHSRMAEKHKQYAYKAKSDAQRDIFKARNRGMCMVYPLDLHGLHDASALDAVENALNINFHMAFLGRRVVKIITGYGKHSAGPPKLLHSVQAFLDANSAMYNCAYTVRVGALFVELFKRGDTPRAPSAWECDCSFDSHKGAPRGDGAVPRRAQHGRRTGRSTPGTRSSSSPDPHAEEASSSNVPNNVDAFRVDAAASSGPPAFAAFQDELSAFPPVQYKSPSRSPAPAMVVDASSWVEDGTGGVAHVHAHAAPSVSPGASREFEPLMSQHGAAPGEAASVQYGAAVQTDPARHPTSEAPAHLAASSSKASAPVTLGDVLALLEASSSGSPEPVVPSTFNMPAGVGSAGFAATAAVNSVSHQFGSPLGSRTDGAHALPPLPARTQLPSHAQPWTAPSQSAHMTTWPTPLGQPPVPLHGSALGTFASLRDSSCAPAFDSAPLRCTAPADDHPQFDSPVDALPCLDPAMAEGAPALLRAAQPQATIHDFFRAFQEPSGAAVVQQASRYSSMQSYQGAANVSPLLRGPAMGGGSLAARASSTASSRHVSGEVPALHDVVSVSAFAAAAGATRSPSCGSHELVADSTADFGDMPGDAWRRELDGDSVPGYKADIHCSAAHAAASWVTPPQEQEQLDMQPPPGTVETPRLLDEPSPSKRPASLAEALGRQAQPRDFKMDQILTAYRTGQLSSMLKGAAAAPTEHDPTKEVAFT